MEQPVTSPCARIPPEILRRIFLTLRNMSSEDDEVTALGMAEKDLAAISVVNKQWRAIALDTSYLWSRVVYLGPDSPEPTNSVEHLKISLIRSGQQKICIVIREEPEINTGLPLQSSPPPGPTRFRSIMAKVMRHIQRVEGLNISVSCRTVVGYVWLFYDDPMILLDKSFPWSGVPLFNLKYLTISEVVLSPQSFHLFLRHNQQLLQLKVVHVVIAPNASDTDPIRMPLLPLHLPSLQQVEWDAFLLHSLQELGPVSMPRASKLTLRTTTPYENIPIMPMPSFPTTVTDLTIRGPFSDEAVLALFLPYGAEQNQPFAAHDGDDLRMLRLHGCEAGAELLSFLSRPAFPRLAYLEVLYGMVTDNDVFRLLDAYENSPRDFEHDGHFQVHIHYCPRTTKQLSKALRERGNGTWLRRQRDQPKKDFMPFFR